MSESFDVALEGFVEERGCVLGVLLLLFLLLLLDEMDDGPGEGVGTLAVVLVGDAAVVCVAGVTILDTDDSVP
jgi:hypothetical protein